MASALISLGSLSLALTSYQRILRYAMLDKPNLSFGGQIFYFLWQSCAIASRVIALALFATQFKLVVFIGVGVHWAVMTLWIILQVRTFLFFIINRLSKVEISRILSKLIYTDYLKVKMQPAKLSQKSISIILSPSLIHI